MTDAEINVAIAEACGWQRWKTKDPSGITVVLRPSDPVRDNYWKECGCEITTDSLTFDRAHLRTIVPKSLPDYCNDLNAMHEAEKILNGDERIQFMGWLNTLVVDRIADNTAWVFSHATARQRAEAFIATIVKTPIKAQMCCKVVTSQTR